MQITPPFAYPAIAALRKTDLVVLPRPGETPGFCRELHVIPLSYTELPVAQRDYPLIFVSGDAGKTFMPMAVLGLKQQQNLFVTSLGWDPAVYLPAYVRRYPFCMAKVRVDDREQAERIVCVAEEAVGAQGETLFDGQGAALPKWAEMEKLLNEFEADLLRSEEMCRLIAEAGLLEPFDMQAQLNTGETMAVTGMYRIAEARLQDLPAEKLKSFVQQGIVGRIYAHLLSLDNFRKLVDRAAARAATAAARPMTLN